MQVSASANDGAVHVRVRDNGRGIRPEARQRIFEKFNASPAAGTTTHSVGLGLAFCKLAVHAHGGTIGVEDNEGGGSVFWFELPRAAA